MKNHSLHIFIVLSLAFWVGCVSKSPVKTPLPEKFQPTTPSFDNTRQPVPSPSKDFSTVVLDKNFFVIHYDTKHRLAKYVEYRLTADNLKKSFVIRKDRFHEDLELFRLKVTPVGADDYKYSGYDRGHLAPSGDFEWSEEANDATFTMANMVPQKPSLNRVAWRGLEEQVRGWACAEGELRIVTGPLINAGSTQLSSGITVPQRFFKVVLDETPPRKAIGFVFEQADNRFRAYQEKVASVRDIETLTGVDFFSDIPAEEQDKIENHSDLEQWRGEKCKGSGAMVVNANLPVNLAGGMCAAGTLKPASIRGCCSHHGGVMGPKKHRACCTTNNEVICQDGSISASCRCGGE